MIPETTPERCRADGDRGDKPSDAETTRGRSPPRERWRRTAFVLRLLCDGLLGDKLHDTLRLAETEPTRGSVLRSALARRTCCAGRKGERRSSRVQGMVGHSWT